MKLTILGGGGFRVPLVFKALIADEAPGRVTELRLYDTDATRLEAIRAVLDELAEAAEQPHRAPTAAHCNEDQPVLILHSKEPGDDFLR